MNPLADLLAYLIAIFVMIIGPVTYTTSITETSTQNNLKTEVSLFYHDIATSGYLSQNDYYNLLSKISTSGGGPYVIDIVYKSVNSVPDGTGDYAPSYKTYNLTDIFNEMEANNGICRMKTGDRIYISVHSTSPTMVSRLLSTFANGDYYVYLSATAGGLVGNTL